MDDTGKLWLLEGNTDLGCGYAGDTIAGKDNPDASVNDPLTKRVIHDLYALLGLDQYKKQGNAAAWFQLHDTAAATASGGGGNSDANATRCGLCGYPQDSVHP